MAILTEVGTLLSRRKFRNRERLNSSADIVGADDVSTLQGESNLGSKSSELTMGYFGIAAILR